MRTSSVSHLRRSLLGAAGIASVAPALVWSETLSPTPRQTSGPFYPEELPLDNDNDLTRVRGRDGRAMGHTTDLSGRIVNTSARPLDGVRVEIWQCDANGRYHHPGDRRSVPLDENFQGFGHTVTDAEGNYRFRTILPAHYPGRTPHIHAAVFLPGQRPFVTQIYNRDEPRNADDFLFNRIPVEQRPLVVTEFRRTASGEADFIASFDFVLGATPQQA